MAGLVHGLDTFLADLAILILKHMCLSSYPIITLMPRPRYQQQALAQLDPKAVRMPPVGVQLKIGETPVRA